MCGDTPASTPAWRPGPGKGRHKSNTKKQTLSISKQQPLPEYRLRTEAADGTVSTSNTSPNREWAMGRAGRISAAGRRKGVHVEARREGA